MRFFRALTLLGLALAAVAVASCEGRGERIPETGATLEGTVTYGKQKVMYAMVVAAGPGGPGSATGYIGEDGRYKLENVPLGQVKLAVITDAAKGQVMHAGLYAGPDAKGSKKKAPPKFIDVDQVFADPETSGLSTTVNQGKNEYNIVMKKPGKSKGP